MADFAIKVNSTAILESSITNLAKSLDNGFVLISGYLVFIMQVGFAMLTAGSVRTKNTQNVLLKNAMDACVGGLAYFLFGYAFAYGPGGNR
jgi:ammonium transporter, Amt family